MRDEKQSSFTYASKPYKAAPMSDNVHTRHVVPTTIMMYDHMPDVPTIGESMDREVEKELKEIWERACDSHRDNPTSETWQRRIAASAAYVTVNAWNDATEREEAEDGDRRDREADRRGGHAQADDFGARTDREASGSMTGESLYREQRVRSRDVGKLPGWGSLTPSERSTYNSLATAASATTKSIAQRVHLESEIKNLVEG